MRKPHGRSLQVYIPPCSRSAGPIKHPDVFVGVMLIHNTLFYFFVKLCINSCYHLISLLIAELKAQRPDHDKEQKFDSNCITPGTPFMVNLGKTLRFWVAKKLNEDPGWMNMKVILSDGSVPGEGEHKMMNFIRSQRSAPHHNPNTSHVIYGLVRMQYSLTTSRFIIIYSFDPSTQN